MKNTWPQLPKNIRHQWVRYLSRRNEVKSAVLFGSRARGDNDARSDIDLAIRAPRATRRQWLDIVAYIKDETDSLLPTDVIRWEDASSPLKEKIRKEGLKIYERR